MNRGAWRTTAMESQRVGHDLVTEHILIYKKLPVSYMCVTESLCYKAEINIVDQLYLNKIKSIYIYIKINMNIDP